MSNVLDYDHFAFDICQNPNIDQSNQTFCNVKLTLCRPQEGWGGSPTFLN